MSRPSKYTKDMPGLAAAVCERGATNVEIAEALGVSLASVKKWMAEKPEFSAAIKEAKAKADDQVEESLFKRALGYDFTSERAFKVKDAEGNEKVEVVEVSCHQPADTTAAIFWLKNRRKTEWRDKWEVDHGMSSELTDFLAQVAERSKRVGVDS